MSKGRYHRLAIEAVDGQPVPDTSVSFTTQIGFLLGQQTFDEEPADLQRRRHHDDWNDHGEGDDAISVDAGKTRSGVDIVTSADLHVDNFGNRNFVGFTAPVPGRMSVVRVPAAQITEIAAGRKVAIKALSFNTFTVDASVAPVFAEALLTTGTMSDDGSSITSLNLTSPLVRTKMFAGQDNDFAPLFPKHGELLGRFVQWAIDKGVIENLFLVLRVPSTTPFPGVSGTPPLIGLDGGVAVNDRPIFGFSFLSDDGGVTFTRQTTFNFMFSLRLALIEDHP